MANSYYLATFYKFVAIADCPSIQAHLLAYCTAHNIKGTILIAPEGINGSIATSTEVALQAALDFFCQDPRWPDLNYQTTSGQGKFPFRKLKIRLKKEIVTFRDDQANPSQQVGTYVSPAQWNELIADPEVVVIDTRNHYEVAIGTFRGAIDPHTDSFTEFAAYVTSHLSPDRHPKVAMFCTGGIRCEKASSWMLAAGFPQVYHLQGGILNYLRQVPASESTWQGDCFVFDERVAVTHALAPGSYRLCYDCGLPVALELPPPCPHCGSQGYTAPLSTEISTEIS